MIVVVIKDREASKTVVDVAELVGLVTVEEGEFLEGADMDEPLVITNC